MRLSTTDWLGAEGWDVEDSIALARRLGRDGVDLIDCSSGGIAPRVAIDAGPGYQAGQRRAHPRRGADRDRRRRA